MSPVELTGLLSSADSVLNGVEQSMMRADLPTLEESQPVLERIVRDWTEIKRTVSSTGSEAEDLRGRLRKFHVRLVRLQALGQAALSSINLRLQSSNVSEHGYSMAGAGKRDSDLRTISVNY